MKYEEFKRRVGNLTDRRKHRITGSLGVYDAYKYIRKNKWFNIGRPLSEKEFYAIIRSVNKLLAKELSYGKEIILPHKLGTLELRKRKPQVLIKDGKLVTTYPIDWQATLKLWYEDEEAFQNKTLIRNEVDEVYKVYYNKNKADYNNKSFYFFQTNRELKKALMRNINLGVVDAFIEMRYDKRN